MSLKGEQEVIATLTEDFGQYLKSAAEVSNIRRSLAVYMRKLSDGLHKGKDSPTCEKMEEWLPPSFGDGLDLSPQHVEAIRSYVKAREEYDQLAKLIKVDRQEVPSKYDATRLSTHLQYLRARKLNRQIAVLQRYSLRLDDDLLEGSTHDPPDSSITNHSYNLKEDRQHDSSCLNKVSDLEQKLDRMIVQANNRLEHERGLLADIKNRNEGEDLQRKETHLTRFSALSATRDELVRWLEDQLPEFSDEDIELHSKSDNTCVNNSAQTEAHILECYQEYVNAREKCLKVAIAATVPLRKEEVACRPDERNASVLQTKPRQPLLFMENMLVGLQRQQQADATQIMYSTSQLTQERSFALDMIDRLVDESQLLPAYSTIDRKPVQRVVLEDGYQRNDCEPDTISVQTKAWSVAAERANKALEAAIRENMVSAEKSISALQENASEGREQGALQVKWSNLHGRLGIEANDP